MNTFVDHVKKHFERITTKLYVTGLSEEFTRDAQNV